jgi:hypothetical protein
VLVADGEYRSTGTRLARLVPAIEALQRDAARLEYLLEDDPRFRRFADGTWDYERELGAVHAGATWREAVDAAMAAAEVSDAR